MRPRKRDLHLPVRVYFHHGAYWRVEGGKWTRLGKEFTATMANGAQLPRALRNIRDHAYRVLTAAKQNAKKRRIDFGLTREDVDKMLDACGWRCAVTRSQFSLEVVNGRKPFAPSIDRRDSDGGYTPGNCRIVCLAANYGMNVWGEGVLHRLAKQGRRVLAKAG